MKLTVLKFGFYVHVCVCEDENTHIGVEHGSSKCSSN